MSVPHGALSVALIGNPNTGKSTLFNALSGSRQRVGNYPGVTVEKKIGRLEVDGLTCQLVDLPGTYSLAPRSPDEMIAVDVLLGRRGDVPPPDVILCIVDASNLERNLYLVSQVLELNRPVVLALNMVDVAEAKGLSIDFDRLKQQLPVPIVATEAHRKAGLAELRSALRTALEAAAPEPRPSPFPAPFQDEVSAIERASHDGGTRGLPRFLAERLLLDVGGYLEHSGLPGITPALLGQVQQARQRLGDAGLPVPAVESMSRYGWVARVLDGVVQRPASRRVTASDKFDRVLTHRVWGTLVFVLLMVTMFQAVFRVADPASQAMDWLQSQASQLVQRGLAEGPLQSLICDGFLAGVGGVLVFLPQIFVLFLFIAVLEDCGYMARAAYLMDKVMSRIGLSGKSFIPLLSSFACAIPGIMAARVIENRRDRMVTMLVAPLMSCSARLPVYTLLIGAFIPDRRVLGGMLGLPGLTMFAMYALGVVTAIAMAWLLKKTLLRGATPPFVMELPSYKLPGLGIVLHRVLERGWAFVRRAGTLIVAVTIIVWAAGYYPRQESSLDPALVARQQTAAVAVADAEKNAASPDELARRQAELAAADHEIEAAYLSQSYLGRVGQWIEPVIRPLGWDWRIGCAAIASFPAREVVVATLGVIYRLGSEESEESETLKETLRAAKWDGTDRPVFGVPTALSLMVFFALCAQCASTLAVMRRETASWRWPIFTFVYMTSLAYVGAFVTYQVGEWLLRS